MGVGLSAAVAPARSDLALGSVGLAKLPSGESVCVECCRTSSGKSDPVEKRGAVKPDLVNLSSCFWLGCADSFSVSLSIPGMSICNTKV